MKKYNKSQELSTVFPSWAKIRDPNSLGYLFLNTFGKQLSNLDHELTRMEYNQYLPTFNLDEPDILYKVELPTTFSFVDDITDPTRPTYYPPSLQGFAVSTTISGYIDVSIAENNDIESFWYTSTPSRVSSGEEATGDYILLTLTDDEVTWSGELIHHLADDQEGGGTIWVEVVDGSPYIRKNETTNKIERTEIRIEGITRKGTIDEETFAFGWDEKQKSLKEWRRINYIDISNMNDGSTIQVRSADFNQGPYLSFWNDRFSDDKKKIDEFYDLGTTLAGNSTLEYISHMTDDFKLLIQGFSEKEAKQTWELLDASNNTLDLVDMAIQPFTNRMWTVTEGGMLYCYDLEDETISDIDDLREKTAGAWVQLDFDNVNILYGEDFIFRPLFLRMTQELLEFRVWWEDPNGIEYNHNDTAWQYPSNQNRVFTIDTTVTPAIRGEWLFVVESVFVDGTTQNDRVIASVKYKNPLTSINLSGIIGQPIVGIDFDSDQKMWILTDDDKYHQVNLHKDIALIDYDNKVIYFSDNYTDIKVTI